MAWAQRTVTSFVLHPSWGLSLPIQAQGLSWFLCIYSSLLPCIPRLESIFLCLYSSLSLYPWPPRSSNHDVSLLRPSPAFWLLVTMLTFHPQDSGLNFQDHEDEGAVPRSAFPPRKQSPGFECNCVLTNICFRNSTKKTHCSREHISLDFVYACYTITEIRDNFLTSFRCGRKEILMTLIYISYLLCVPNSHVA